MLARFLPCNRVSICSPFYAVFLIEINKNEREKFFSLSGSDSGLLRKLLPHFSDVGFQILLDYIC